MARNPARTTAAVNADCFIAPDTSPCLWRDKMITPVMARATPRRGRNRPSPRIRNACCCRGSHRDPMDPSMRTRVNRTAVAMSTVEAPTAALARSFGASHTRAVSMHPGSKMTALYPAYPYTSYRDVPDPSSNGSPVFGSAGPGSIHADRPDVGDAGVGGRRQSCPVGRAATDATAVDVLASSGRVRTARITRIRARARITRLRRRCRRPRRTCPRLRGWCRGRRAARGPTSRGRRTPCGPGRASRGRRTRHVRGP